MFKYLVNVYSWENSRIYSSKKDFQEGDKVVVGNEFGNDIGTVEGKVDVKDEASGEIVRKATERDLEIFDENEKKQKDILEFSRQEAKRLDLAMKIVDVRIVFGRGSVLVVFIADGRVDFRDLVKSISRKCHRSIRMQQIGSRDEARRLGGGGTCGRELCCIKFSGNIPSITTDMARIQQVAHRGSERISGLCGRLMCCLSYESQQYSELVKGMPEVHSRIKTKEGKGEVIEINAIKQEIRVKLNDGQIITIKKGDLK